MFRAADQLDTSVLQSYAQEWRFPFAANRLHALCRISLNANLERKPSAVALPEASCRLSVSETCNLSDIQLMTINDVSGGSFT